MYSLPINRTARVDRQWSGATTHNFKVGAPHMSDQLTSQSRSNESGITRRTALRGAAWSASAVTVVVATPNIAAASVTPTGTAVGSVTRSGNGDNGTTLTFSVRF